MLSVYSFKYNDLFLDISEFARHRGMGYTSNLVRGHSWTPEVPEFFLCPCQAAQLLL